MQSDRHPDQAVYLLPPPDGPRPWTRWVPEIVVEVVSEGGEDRDYVGGKIPVDAVYYFKSKDGQ